MKIFGKQTMMKKMSGKLFFGIILIVYIFAYEMIIDIKHLPVEKSTVLALCFIAFNFTMFWLSKTNTVCASVWRYLKMFWLALALVLGWGYIKEHWWNKYVK